MQIEIWEYIENIDLATVIYVWRFKGEKRERDTRVPNITCPSF